MQLLPFVATGRGHGIVLRRPLALAEELGDGETGFLVERGALDEARSRQFRLSGRLE
jgi:hypothetical protein